MEEGRPRLLRIAGRKATERLLRREPCARWRRATSLQAAVVSASGCQGAAKSGQGAGVRPPRFSNTSVDTSQETKKESVTYMSPERIRNENYSYAADIWSLGLTALECATGRYPYDLSGGEADLMLQILEDPSPTPPQHMHSEEFCSFIDACLQKDADARPTCDQKYEGPGVDLAEYNKSVHDPAERLSQIAHMLAVHYYLIFDGGDDQWRHMKSFYGQDSTFGFSGETHVGKSDIFDTLSRIRKTLKGNSRCEKIGRVMEKVYCHAHGEEGMSVRVSGSFIMGNEFLVCADGFCAEGMLSIVKLSPDILSKQAGHFQEDFFMEPGTAMGCYVIARQELHIDVS